MEFHRTAVNPCSRATDCHNYFWHPTHPTFVRKSEMAVIHGMRNYVAKANTPVVLPVSVVHNNMNASKDVQSVVTLILPEPEKGQPLGQGVTVPSANPTQAQP